MKMKISGFRDPAIELEWAQRSRGKVAFLRHKIPHLEHRESSDWDLAVRDLEGVRKVTLEVLGRPRVTIPRGYVEQRYYDWGQIDFLPEFEWNGIVYLEAERFWDGVSEADDGLPRPRIAHDAFVVWMTGLLTGGFYNPRYDDLLREAWSADGKELKECLRWAFGEELAATMGDFLGRGSPIDAKALVSDLRRTLKQRAFLRSPGDAVEKVIRHWSRELFFHWKPPFPWVAFLGPDGAGKSTVIEGVKDRLVGSRLKTLVMHWRPKSAGHEPADAVPVSDPHGRRPRGFVFSTLALGLLWMRWMIGRFGKTWHQRAKQKILISDRYYPDLLVDPRRYLYGGSLNLAKLLFWFFPKPDLTILLVGPPGRVHARKKEVSLAEMGRQMKEYSALKDQLPNLCVVVDVDRDEKSVIDEVFEAMETHVFFKNS